MRVTVLVGGVGGARFLLGLKAALGLPAPGPDVGRRAGEPPHEITAVVNVGDDIWLHGLRICPDLDTCMYTLGGGIDTERGWGRAGETWAVRDELAAYGADPSWFGLGDRDIATHLVRTRMLRAGYPLSDVTAALCHRWQPGVRLLPVTDDRVETHVVIDDPETGPQARKAIHFQEWWIRHKAAPAAHRVRLGRRRAGQPCCPACRRRSPTADVVLLAPSNPVVSIGAMLDVPGAARRAARRPRRRSSGCPRSSAAARCAAWPTPAWPRSAWRPPREAVGRHYGARADGGLLDGWLVHTGDAADVPGVEVRAVPLLMTDVDGDRRDGPARARAGRGRR